MVQELERNLGEQPILRVMQENGLNAQALVAASAEHITYKMVARARKGRRLTPRVQGKILTALLVASGQDYKLTDLFTY